MTHSLQETDLGQGNSLTGSYETVTVYLGILSHLKIPMSQKAWGIQTPSEMTGSDS